MRKTCYRCGIEKPFGDFNKNSSKKDGLFSICKKCRTEKRYENRFEERDRARKYRENNPEKIKKKRHEKHLRNKEENNKISKEYYHGNKKTLRDQQKQYYLSKKDYFDEKHKKYYQENKNKAKEYNIEYRKNNQEKCREAARLYQNKRRSEDINFKILSNLRHRLRYFMKKLNTEKCESSINLLGCSLNYFKRHIENQFTEGMSWDNYGYYGWHLDHERPCASYDLKDPEQQRLCFHYTNLQPLWWYDNFAKSDKWAG